MSGMGLGVGDTDGNGSEELFVSNYSHQNNSLYVSDGGGMWEDWGALAGFGTPSFRFLGWGATFFDVEADGDLDLYVANGHVYPQVDEVDPTTSYDQRDQLFLNDGGGGFTEWHAPPDSPLARPTSTRGVVRVDFDNDGDSDLLVNGLEAPPMLLRNDTVTAGRWIGVSLAATAGPAGAPGTRVLLRAGGREQLQVHRLGSSYMSSEDPRHLFGLGDADHAEVQVVWPDGRSETWGPLAAGRYHALAVGTGRPTPSGG
jgi:hypothetical protein